MVVVNGSKLYGLTLIVGGLLGFIMIGLIIFIANKPEHMKARDRQARAGFEERVWKQLSGLDFVKIPGTELCFAVSKQGLKGYIDLIEVDCDKVQSTILPPPNYQVKNYEKPRS